MLIDGYDGWAGEFPYEVGDVFVTDTNDDLAILVGANFAYIQFYFVIGVPQSIGKMDAHIMSSRIERVIDGFRKVGHIDASSLQYLKER